MSMESSFCQIGAQDGHRPRLVAIPNESVGAVVGRRADGGCWRQMRRAQLAEEPLRTSLFEL